MTFAIAPCVVWVVQGYIVVPRAELFFINGIPSSILYNSRNTVIAEFELLSGSPAFPPIGGHGGPQASLAEGGFAPQIRCTHVL